MKRIYATFTVQDKKMRCVDTVKYLGVTVYARLPFIEYLLNAGLKASSVVRAMASMTPNIGDSKQSRRILLSSVYFFTEIQYGLKL